MGHVNYRVWWNEQYHEDLFTKSTLALISLCTRLTTLNKAKEHMIYILTKWWVCVLICNLSDVRFTLTRNLSAMFETSTGGSLTKMPFSASKDIKDLMFRLNLLNCYLKKLVLTWLYVCCCHFTQKRSWKSHECWAYSFRFVAFKKDTLDYNLKNKAVKHHGIHPEVTWCLKKASDDV